MTSSIQAAPAPQVAINDKKMYPIYAKWADAYKKETGNGLNYQSIGSSQGNAQIKGATVDFGASDMPLPRR